MKKGINFIKTHTQKTWVQFILFSVILWLIFVDLHINRHLTDIIIGPHSWRKSDTYAQIMNYYYNGLNFFDHSYYYNLFNSNGKAVGEFPLFYYFIALQLKIFGNYSIIVKINWIVLSFIGLFSLFKIVFHFLKTFWLSVVVSTSLFLSPIFSFYFISYLPDSIALNLMFIGGYLFLKSTSKKRLITALIIIGVSGMVKPFFMIPFIAYVLILVLNKTVIKNQKLPKFNGLYLIPFVMVAIWYIYAFWYNSLTECKCFLTSPQPIWDLNVEEYQKVILKINNRWFDEYVNPLVLKITEILLIINLLWWSKKYRLFNIYYIFSIIGSALFILLFFKMFEQHDYYIFPILFLIPLTFGLFLYKILTSFKNTMLVYILSICMVSFSFSQLNYSLEKNQKRRTTPWVNEKHKYINYIGLEHFLVKNNVQPNDLILTFSDYSPTYALLLLNRKGWSGYQTKYKNYSVEKIIDMGATILVINYGFKMNEKDSILIQPFLNYPIDDTNNIYLYDLKPYKK